jgi:SAM-dependent methyltransferase
VHSTLRQEGKVANDRRPSVTKDVWASGVAYEPYVGRWSRFVACKFVNWLALPHSSHWLDVGCGTGALSETILQTAGAHQVSAVDRSTGYIAFARERLQDKPVHFVVGDATALPIASATHDAVVSGLLLNFVAQPQRAVAEMARTARPGGMIAAYVWDYAGKMQLMRHFWNAAAALDPLAYDLDEGRRFPLCKPKPLTELFESVGLGDVAVQAIDIETNFVDFVDYWSPFLGGQGPAPSYAMSLDEPRRGALRERIRASLPFATDGSIPLVARAWGVRGIAPA